jgi:hypothetical protein
MFSISFLILVAVVVATIPAVKISVTDFFTEVKGVFSK